MAIVCYLVLTGLVEGWGVGVGGVCFLGPASVLGKLYSWAWEWGFLSDPAPPPHVRKTALYFRQILHGSFLPFPHW